MRYTKKLLALSMFCCLGASIAPMLATPAAAEEEYHYYGKVEWVVKPVSFICRTALCYPEETCCQVF